MKYMVLGNFEKKLAQCEAEMRPGNEFRHPYQKSVDTLKFLFTQVSYISQQKKVKTISHVRQIEGPTKLFVNFVCFLINKVIALAYFISFLSTSLTFR